MEGAGSATKLNATNPDQEMIKLNGSSSMSNLETTTNNAPGSKQSTPQECAVDVTGSGNSVSNVTVQGAETNGIRLDDASNSKISSDLVEGSNADGIALMNGSSDNSVKGNEVYQAGDDSYSDDSYGFDSSGKQDSGNDFEDNLSLDNSYGRGMALMGATGDTAKGNTIEGSKWMGIVAGTDSNSKTLTGSNDTIENNTVTGSNGDAVDVMSAGGALSQSGAGMTISGNGSSGTGLSFTPVSGLEDRSQYDASYQVGTGSGRNN